LNSICIIGLGTVGGYLAKNISMMLNSVTKLVLIDNDAVLPHNIQNSIYEEKNIFDSKTTALKRKIERQGLEIEIINTLFVEGITEIPKCDLVIDCSDVTYNRGEIVDARLYISYDKLIIDCKKNMTREELQEGQYLSRLTKSQINYAVSGVIMLIEDGTLKQLIEKQAIHKIPISTLSEEAKLEISKVHDDIIYDNNPYERKLINLKETYPEIIDINKNNEVVVYVGAKDNAVEQRTFPVQNLRTINDIVSNFGALISPTQFNFNYYIISVTNYNKGYYVEILPETGSA
jgi:hypothetical protein